MKPLDLLHREARKRGLHIELRAVSGKITALEIARPDGRVVATINTGTSGIENAARALLNRISA